MRSDSKIESDLAFGKTRKSLKYPTLKPPFLPNYKFFTTLCSSVYQPFDIKFWVADSVTTLIFLCLKFILLTTDLISNLTTTFQIAIVSTKSSNLWKYHSVIYSKCAKDIGIFYLNKKSRSRATWGVSLGDNPLSFILKWKFLELPYSEKLPSKTQFHTKRSTGNCFFWQSIQS